MKSDYKQKILFKLKEYGEYIGRLDLPKTSEDNNHMHNYEVDELGNGRTTGVIPIDSTMHTHIIEAWNVSPAEDGHSHTVYDTGLKHEGYKELVENDNETKIAVDFSIQRNVFTFYIGNTTKKPLEFYNKYDSSETDLVAGIKKVFGSNVSISEVAKEIQFARRRGIGIFSIFKSEDIVYKGFLNLQKDFIKESIEEESEEDEIEEGGGIANFGNKKAKPFTKKDGKKKENKVMSLKTFFEDEKTAKDYIGKDKIAEAKDYPSQDEAEAMIEWTNVLKELWFSKAPIAKKYFDLAEQQRLKGWNEIILAKNSPWSVRRGRKGLELFWDDTKATALGLNESSLKEANWKQTYMLLASYIDNLDASGSDSKDIGKDLANTIDEALHQASAVFDKKDMLNWLAYYVFDNARTYKESKESADKDKVKEGYSTNDWFKAREFLYKVLEDLNYHTENALIEAVLDGNVNKAQQYFNNWLKKEKQGYL